MKIEVQTNIPRRKLVGKLSDEGVLNLLLHNYVNQAQKTASLGHSWAGTEGTIFVNSEVSLDCIEGTPIYEGDTVTITF
jgi:hypothetical protein